MIGLLQTLPGRRATCLMEVLDLSNLSSEDFNRFVENIGTELAEYGEDHVFRRTEEFLRSGFYHTKVDSPFYTRFSKVHEFETATLLHNTITASGISLWTSLEQKLHAEAVERGEPPILLITLPKSGSVYLQQVISTLLKVPHIQISLRRFPNDYSLTESIRLFARGGAIAQTHMDASEHNLNALAAAGIRHIHVHVRDPRQATASWAHFYRTRMSGPATHLRYLVDPHPPPGFDDLSHEQQFTWHADHFYTACLRWIAQWMATAERDPRFQITFTDQAQLQSDGLQTIRTILQPFGYVPDSIAGVPEPEPGIGHFRQGSNDEWQEVMPRPAQILMNNLLPGRMIRMFGWGEV